MTGTTLDQNDRFSSQKSEPSLDAADAFSTAPPAAVPELPPAPVENIDAGDMPSWLNSPGEETSESSAWWRTGLWVAGTAIVIGAAAYGSNWLLEQQEAEGTAPVTAELPPVPAPAASPPVAAPRPADALPPLVLLPPEQGGKPKTDPAAAPTPDAAPAVAPAVAETPAVAAAAPVTAPGAAAATAPLAAPVKPVAPAPAPVALPAPVVAKSPEPPVVQAPAVPKPAPAKPAAVTAKPAVSPATVAAKPAAKPAAVAAKKKPVKRVAAAKPQPKKVRGVTLPPPRDRVDDEDRDGAPAGKCISGELARECEARLKGR